MYAQMNVENNSPETETNRQVARWLVRESMGVVMMAIILFVSAGHLNWMMGWAMVAITALWIAATAIVVIPRNPELLAERVRPKKGTKSWDMVILSVYGIISIVRYIVGGLDQRYAWSTGISLPVQIMAVVIAVLGYGLVVWATGTNAFFSQTVRIQEERGHSVISTGPYQFVRHPAYVGVILFELAAPFVLGSWWALPLSVIAIALFIVRTALEDKILHKELAGYADYARKVRYRILPDIW
jgi:protein-S-isoprenylcysteine O-methyltransferase Ste14